MYTELPAKLQPFSLTEVPSELDWCIEETERELGEVLVPAPAYKLVLVLRWLLSYAHNRYDNCVQTETRQIFWRVLDEYGFRTEIWLFEPEIEDYDSFREMHYIVQPQRWAKLAVVNGFGTGKIDKIRTIDMSLGAAFGGCAEFSAEVGVKRLFMEAAYTSMATHHYPINNRSDGKMESWRCDRNYVFMVLGLVTGDHGYGVDLDITFREDLTRI